MPTTAIMQVLTVPYGVEAIVGGMPVVIGIAILPLDHPAEPGGRRAKNREMRGSSSSCCVVGLPSKKFGLCRPPRTHPPTGGNNRNQPTRTH